MKKRSKRTAALLLSGLITLSGICMMTGCGGGNDGSADGTGGKDAHAPEEPVSLSLLCVGDVMAHSPNIKSAYDSATGTYDFYENYVYVADYITWSDLALCNMETTFEGTTPRGYPTFNAPDSLAQAVKAVGFDVAMTSNNHMMDSGFNGMQRTIQVLREQGLVTVGSNYEGEARYAVTEVKGINVGIVAYTYETTGPDDTGVTINGTRIGEDSQKLINSFNYNELDTSDYARIQEDIDGARGAGADIVIVYLHWGEEYQREPNSHQIEMAQRVADMGADIIFASHPHVLQKVDVITASDGQSVPVFYSMGNFISNQREETLGSIANKRFTEQGMMACVNLTIMKTTGEILSEELKVIPTWVDKYGSTEYRIIPLDGGLEANPTLSESGHLSRAKQAYEDVRALIGDQYLEGVSVDMGVLTEEEDDGNTEAA